jgi:hypothetical protein
MLYSKPPIWLSRTSKHVGGRNLSDDLYGESLGSNRFRLLQLDPVSPPANGLRCTMQVFDLQDPPEYVALSYTWGDPDWEFDDSVTEAVRASYKVKQHAIVNDKPLLISTNLFNALLALQANPEVHKSLPIWADAVCINQDDKSEKSAQVNAMGSIYMKAELATVWLGTSSPLTARVMEIIQRVSVILDDMDGERYNQIGIYAGNLADQQWLRSLGIQDISLDEWHGIAVLLKKTWFYRAWTLQEPALARDTLCLCGSTAIDISKFALFSAFILKTQIGPTLAQLLQDRNPRGEFAEELGTEMSNVDEIRMLCQGDSYMRSWHERRIRQMTRNAPFHGGSVLLWLLWFNSNREAADMRDKIFSLLGIVHQITRNNDLSPCPLMADYSKTAAEVCFETSRYILESTDCLAVLSLPRNRRKSPSAELPSWVSDFSIPLNTSFIVEDLVRSTPFDASMSSQASQCGIVVEGERLNVCGLKLGVIAESTEPEYSNLVEMMRLFSICHTRQWPSSEAAATILCKTLTADRIYWPCSSWTQLATSFRFNLIYRMSERSLSTPGYWAVNTLYKNWQSWGFLVAWRGGEITPTVAEIEEWSSRLRSDPTTATYLKQEAQLFEEAALGPWSNRCLFRTEQRHIGLGPDSLQPGDCVWVLSGGRVPFVLRQIDANDENRYELVGEAYVHGVMYGEAVKDLPLDEWKDIVLE